MNAVAAALSEADHVTAIDRIGTGFIDLNALANGVQDKMTVVKADIFGDTSRACMEACDTIMMTSFFTLEHDQLIQEALLEQAKKGKRVLVCALRAGEMGWNLLERHGSPLLPKLRSYHKAISPHMAMFQVTPATIKYG